MVEAALWRYWLRLTLLGVAILCGMYVVSWSRDHMERIKYLPGVIGFKGSQSERFSHVGLEILNLASSAITSGMTGSEMEEELFRYIVQADVSCASARMIGATPSEQWPLCVQESYELRAGNCLIYSFTEKQTISFETAIASDFRCRVRLHNPLYDLRTKIHTSQISFKKQGLGAAIGNRLHQQKKIKVDLRTLSDFRDEVGESQSVIDYLKVDLDSETVLKTFKTMLYNKALHSVKQLAFSVKTSLSMSQDQIRQYYGILNQLEKIGFRKWHVTKDVSEREYTSQLTGKTRHSHQVGFINLEFIHNYAGTSIQDNLGLLPAMSWKNISSKRAEHQFDKFIHQLHYKCGLSTRVGRANDGGWQLCTDEGFELLKPCLVYSFGINNDWSFDDAISKHYGCEVRAFDPSMAVKDHKRDERIWFYQRGLGGKKETIIKKSSNWQMNTLGGFRKDFGDSERVIDYLKVDIEHSEWEAFDAALKEGAFSKVKQLAFEIHTEEMHAGKVTSTDTYKFYYGILKQLEDLGFRKWNVHNNQWGMYDSKRTGERSTCCFEMSYVNVRLKGL